jgi:hypothetical protein
VTGNRPRPSFGLRLRLSLRAQLAFVVLMGVAMAWVVHRARVQRESVATIAAAGAINSYDPPRAPRWLIDSVGIDYFSGIHEVFLIVRRPDRTSAAIRRLTRLKELVLYGESVNDTYIANLEGLGDLEWLTLGETTVTDKGLSHVKGLTNLRVLDLKNTRISDAGLVHLKRLSNLHSLFLHGSKVSDAGVGRLKRVLPRVAILR